MWILSGAKGSSSIFLCLILAAVMTLTFAFIAAARHMAALSCGDGLLQLAGRSVLSEFDRGLKEDYGIIACRGQQGELARSLAGYVDYTLVRGDGIRRGAVNTDTSAYALCASDRFEREILEVTRYEIARGLLQQFGAASGGGEGKEVDKRESGRVLRNGSVIASLPSGAIEGGSTPIDRVKAAFASGSGLLTGGGTRILTGRYIMKHFRSGQHQDLNRETFFKYEVEYILVGGRDDDANRRRLRAQLLLLRNGINFATIYLQPQLLTQVITAAEAITPGPGGLVTQLVLAEAWAAAEAENDVRLLEHGRKVPHVKTAANWAVDLDSIVKNKEADYIDTNSPAGLTYSGYLQLFLYCMDRDLKYSRMMDLMQINIQATRDSSFLIKEHCLGMRVQSTINGRSCSYDQQY
ncbi:MAG: DUF5702 domain-containing protein [Anaerovoracaceae bacterium]|jgi:hypothetical protein